MEGAAQQVGSVIANLIGVCYSEHYMEASLQQVDSVIVAGMEWVRVKIMWMFLHSSGTV